ncbi:hypothetical protein ACFO3O_21870 [Dokdonia ponticola]|uniref:Lipoprotein n=2 Tax=Dokdonia ponticola TaxID=2041041 RepID=A0ABV9I379_9FLAO
MCKRLSIYILFFLILLSCNRQSKVDVRKPFEINHKLTCEGLIENGYTRLWGDDVVLVSKEIADTLVYYQLEYHREEIEPEVGFINNDDTFIIIPEGSPDFQTKLCEDAYIYSRYFKLKFGADKHKALEYIEAIDRSQYKIIRNNRLYPQEEEYFEVLNLKTQDTFNCSITREKQHWYFQSSISF